ncbi:MAG: sulfite exporter TauE/SafE family protein [Gammaproteobacteria bacterium]|nr:sulfite exporter TauE/SafE family protein [Gammaproteobacteria bacterium]
MNVRNLVLGTLIGVYVWYVWCWYRLERAPRPRLAARDLALSFATNFFDALGVGNFAPTTAIFKMIRRMPDENIPGTLNAGYGIPTCIEALIFIAVVRVDVDTLVGMIAASVVGVWLGAGVVARLPRRSVQLAMGSALLLAAGILLAVNMHWVPAGGEAVGLSGWKLPFAIAVNFILGGLMSLGIGLYAPCLILVSLLGMSPLVAFPIMMGSCAFLLAFGGVRFIRSGRYDYQAALGLAIGGIPGVLVAIYLVKSLPLQWLRWLVLVAVVYAAGMLLASARKVAPEPTTPAT